MVEFQDKIIEVENLTKTYGELKAVDNVSFNVEKGEIFSLVGPNGAGKTTTVEILECLRNPTNGSAKLFGFEVTENEEEIKKRIGVMPQEFNTFDRLSVKENIELMKDIYGTGTDLEPLLERLELEEAKDRNFEKLSGGMKRRVGIAMALTSDPELLFLDEPTTGLDPQARTRLWDVIRDLRKTGVTIFLTTHYMEEVEELSDRAGIMLEGKLLSISNVDDLISQYGGSIRLVVKNGPNAKNILKDYTDDISTEKSGAITARFEKKEKAAEAHLAVYRELSGKFEVNLIGPSMDDVFLNVAGGKINEKGELVS